MSFLRNCTFERRGASLNIVLFFFWSLPSFGLRSACFALRCVARSEGHRSGNQEGQTGLGLDSGRFSNFFISFLFFLTACLRHCSCFAALMMARGISLLRLFPYPLCIGSIVSFVTASSFYRALRLLARSREEPPNICGGFGSASHTSNIIRPNPSSPSLVYGINLTPLVGWKFMDAAFAKKKHTFKTNILSPSHAKKLVKF